MNLAFGHKRECKIVFFFFFVLFLHVVGLLVLGLSSFVQIETRKKHLARLSVNTEDLILIDFFLYIDCTLCIQNIYLIVSCFYLYQNLTRCTELLTKIITQPAFIRNFLKYTLDAIDGPSQHYNKSQMMSQSQSQNAET